MVPQDNPASIYAAVIQEVHRRVSKEFEDTGREAALRELFESWVSKLVSQRTLEGHTTDELYTLLNTYGQIQHLHTQQLSHPQYVQQAAALPHPQSMVQPQSMAQVQAQAHAQYPYQNPPVRNFTPTSWTNQNYQAAQSVPAAAHLANFSSHNVGAGPSFNSARPRPQMNPRQGTQYPNFPQNDGHDGEISKEEADRFIMEKVKERGVIMQFDGEGDDDDEEPEEGDSEAENQEGGNEESLNSSLDSSDDEAAETTRNLVVCIFEKVTRAKTKWRCVLKEGMMTLNGKDYVFHKNTGEFDW